MISAIHSSNPVVKAVIEGAAPRPARLAAARGILPLPHADLLEVLVALAHSDDGELAQHARETLATQDDDALRGSIESGSIAPTVLDFLAGQENLPFSVQESLVTSANLPATTLVRFAKQTRSPQILDILATNQQLLIETPAIIDAIIQNPSTSSETGRRATETKQEFFEKARGLEQIAGELRAQGKEAAAEFIEQGEFESDNDALFLAEHVVVPDSETDDSWLALDFIEELYEETPEQRQAIVDKIIGEFNFENYEHEAERVSMINRVLRMGMKDRVKLAVKGDREARNILIRDPNRIVAQAVVNNPRISEQEIEKIAAMRTVTEDVLRQIASSRQWSRSYSVAHNLARNPRTPIANVLNILSRLQLRDLAALSKNKNVSDAVRRQALRLSQARTGK
ncbi:MAG: hypothetical protein LC730_00485 [Acidobacteria bacterium]|nr:hypothetical protein [Acidobacteriota bacterium]MCA1607925.1 hypothetical protein [Acidobacteriota bacterium]